MPTPSKEYSEKMLQDFYCLMKIEILILLPAGMAEPINN